MSRAARLLAFHVNLYLRRRSATDLSFCRRQSQSASTPHHVINLPVFTFHQAATLAGLARCAVPGKAPTTPNSHVNTASHSAYLVPMTTSPRREARPICAPFLFTDTRTHTRQVSPSSPGGCRRRQTLPSRPSRSCCPRRPIASVRPSPLRQSLPDPRLPSTPTIGLSLSRSISGTNPTSHPDHTTPALPYRN